MAGININEPPYNDRFDPSKERTKVLFRPDRALQQAELNELQSIAEHNLRRLGDSVFADGAMQTGMSFSVNETEGTITVEDGLIYLSGKIRPFKKQSISFTGTGIEKIGVTVEQRVVDFNEDPTLLDQTQGVESHLSEGADRLEEVVVLTYNDESTPTIYEFEDGDLFIEPDRPEFSLLNDVLAQRTYDESGSYQVDGFKMYTEPHPDDVNKINLVIDPGTAYVLGYRIQKPSATRIALNKSQEFREVVQETHTYDSSKMINKVGSTSVKEIRNVVARAVSPAEGVTIAKGATDGRDPIPAEYTSIDRASTTIWTNSPEAIYVYGTDYTIIEENGVQYVDWNTGLNGTEPATGTTYFITFEYDRVMTKGVDYQVVTTPHGDGRPGWDTSIDFKGMNGIKPKNTGTIRVSYSFYLAREDVITLDSAGRFVVIEGQPDVTRLAVSPEHTDPKTLKIGSVFIYPNTDVAEARNTGVVRLRMVDLQNMKKRLEDVEYNQVVQALENETIATDDPLALRGVFADPFVDFRRMDMNLSNVAVSFDDASITLVVNSPADQMKAPTFLEGNSNAHSWGRIVTAPFTEIREIHQPIATEAMNVNPYAVYNKLGVLKLTPSSDNWIEEERVTVEEQDTMTVRIDRWWRHNRNTTKHSDLRWLVNELDLDGNQQWDMGLSWQQDVKQGRTGTLTDVATSVRDTAIEFIRQRDISFVATNLQPMANNLYLSFDGHRVPITPTGTTRAGATTGTIMADGTGRATGKFTIPPGIRTGIREVSLQNDTNNAIATYRAQGTLRTITDTITTTRVTVNLYDPLAQSFVFPQDRVVTSFDLYFASKSTTDNVIVQVRGMSEGGFPNQTIYAERILTPADVKVSGNASVATKVALDDPLMCNAGQSYCIVIITDSNEYTMWVGTLGQNLINNPSQVAATQPYVNGVLFSSSNARTWTVHQGSDLKFSVYTAQFNETATVEFGTMEDLDADMILLMATYLTPANTGCTWEIKAVAQSDVGTVSIDNVPWQPIINYVEQLTNPTVIGLVKLRATFTTNRYISPMLLLDDLMFVNFISETSGDYVTLNINAEEAPFNTIKLGYDAHLPQGTTVTPFYSVDGGQTWKPFTATPKVASTSAEFNRYTYHEQVSTSATNKQVKFKLELRASNRFVRPRVRRFTASFKDEVVM